MYIIIMSVWRDDILVACFEILIMDIFSWNVLCYCFAANNGNHLINMAIYHSIRIKHWNMLRPLDRQSLCVLIQPGFSWVYVRVSVEWHVRVYMAAFTHYMSSRYKHTHLKQWSEKKWHNECFIQWSVTSNLSDCVQRYRVSYLVS